MRGTFRPGDLLLVTNIAIKNLRKGDVVAFHKPGTVRSKQKIVHRVQACTPAGLITRGDHNRSTDRALVTEEDLVGKVFAVQREDKTHLVLGGWLGHVRTTALRIWRRVAPVVGWPYRRIRASGIMRFVWHPILVEVHLDTETGPIVKYLHRQQTVACWWPTQDKFWCRKPYDLVLPRPVRRY